MGSFWTALLGSKIAPDPIEFYEFAPIRTNLSWSGSKVGLSTSATFSRNGPSAKIGTPIGAAQIEPIALHFMDAKRDLDDNLREQGSFWQRLIDDLGLSAEDVADLATALSKINQNDRSRAKSSSTGKRT